MADTFETESMLSDALRLLEHVDFPYMKVLECTTNVRVNPERSDEDQLNKLVFIEFIVLVRSIGGNKSVVAVRPKNDDSAPITFAILDIQAGSYTPMSIDELIAFIAEPKGLSSMGIEQVAVTTLKIANLRSMFHPSTNR